MTKEIKIKTGEEDLYDKVLAWGKKRKINNPVTQLNKILEEFGEIVDAKEDAELKDAVGDVAIATILLGNMADVDFRKLDNFLRIEPKEANDMSVIINTMNLLSELGHVADVLNHRKSKYDLKTTLDGVIQRIELLSSSLGFRLYDCIEQAYDEIKDRKGMTINGNFMKEQ